VQAFPDKPIWNTPEEAMDGCASLLTGTGWASNLEHDARREGRRRGLRVAAVVDHWVNYPQRFERDGETVWPHVLWVADAWAENIAREVLPLLPVRQFENLYLKTQVAQVGPPPGDGTLLYVLEPVRQDWGRGVDGEFQALDFLLEHIHLLQPTPIRRILLRPHPSDCAGKYAKYLDSDFPIMLDTSADMAKALSLADVVAGVESFALVLALSAGRDVYSSLPPWAPDFRLPYKEICQIRSINIER
jgi:hypothetical protein